MADLYIDMDALARTRGDLERIRELLHEPLDAMAAQAGRAVQIDVLRSRLEDFGDAWDHGIKKLGEYAGGVTEALDEIERTFSELDAQLADTFDIEG